MEEKKVNVNMGNGVFKEMSETDYISLVRETYSKKTRVDLLVAQTQDKVAEQYIPPIAPQTAEEKAQAAVNKKADEDYKRAQEAKQIQDRTLLLEAEEKVGLQRAKEMLRMERQGFSPEMQKIVLEMESIAAFPRRNNLYEQPVDNPVHIANAKLRVRYEELKRKLQTMRLQGPTTTLTEFTGYYGSDGSIFIPDGGSFRRFAGVLQGSDSDSRLLICDKGKPTGLLTKQVFVHSLGMFFNKIDPLRIKTPEDIKREQENFEKVRAAREAAKAAEKVAKAAVPITTKMCIGCHQPMPINQMQCVYCKVIQPEPKVEQPKNVSKGFSLFTHKKAELAAVVKKEVVLQPKIEETPKIPEPIQVTETSGETLEVVDVDATGIKRVPASIAAKIRSELETWAFSHKEATPAERQVALRELIKIYTKQ